MPKSESREKLEIQNWNTRVITRKFRNSVFGLLSVFEIRLSGFKAYELKLRTKPAGKVFKGALVPGSFL